MATTKASQFEILASGIEVDGRPLIGGYAYFYLAGTTSPATVWDDPSRSQPRVSIQLDGQGRALVYGDTAYKIIIKDATNTSEVYTFDNLKVGTTQTSSKTVIANYAITPDDDIVFVDCTNGAITITSPSSAQFDHPVTIKKIDATANNVTFDPYAAETIDGAATKTLNTVTPLIEITPTTGGWQSTGTGYVAKTGDTMTGPLTLSGNAVGNLQPVTLQQMNAADALKLDASAYTAADVLTKVKTVDGAGSGLDADTVRGKVVNFRGALVYNNSATSGNVVFDSEYYDTDSIHPGSHPSYLTVPSGVTKVRLSAQATFSPDATQNAYAKIYKNLGTLISAGTAPHDVGGQNRSVQISSAIIPVSAGDNFTLNLTAAGGSLLADATGQYNWFAMEIIE